MYSKYSEKDLVDIYITMIDYSGKITPELEFEIEKRGGLNNFKQQLEKQAALSLELKRIRFEVCSLTTRETDFEFVRKLIKSDIYSDNELEEIVKNYFNAQSNQNNDRQITSKTIFGTLVGIVIGSLVGGFVFHLFSILTHEIIYWSLIPIYLLNYFCIKIIVKQSRNNIVVFLGSLLSTIGSLVFGLYLSGIK